MRLAAALLPALAFASASIVPAQDYRAVGTPIARGTADPQILAAMRQVSPERIQANIARMVQFGNRTTIQSNDTDMTPGTGILAEADWIRAQFEQLSKDCGGCLEVKVDDFIEPPQTGARSRIPKPTRIKNVYAILRGTDPAAAKRMYLVTGHYDTRETDVMNTHDPAPGANDDSSGVAVSLECARVLSKLKFPATLVFVTVAGEEQGLNGSHHLSALAKSEGWQLEGVLNNDIVGGDTTPGETLQDKGLVRVFSQGILPTAPAAQIQQMLTLGMENDSPSRQLARQVLDVDRSYFPARIAVPQRRSPGAQPFQAVMELRLDRFLRGGDHKSFSDAGFPAVRFTEWRENFDHQHQHVRVENGKQFGDLLQFDDFNYISNVARLNLATLAELALSPGAPQNVSVVTTNLDNNTTLKWAAPTASTGAVQYQIVWRPTDANDWQYSADAAKFAGGDGLSATLPVSKDNVFFGVRACDANGHCSAAVAPVPELRAR